MNAPFGYGGRKCSHLIRHLAAAVYNDYANGIVKLCPRTRQSNTYEATRGLYAYFNKYNASECTVLYSTCTYINTHTTLLILSPFPIFASRPQYARRTPTTTQAFQILQEIFQAPRQEMQSPPPSFVFLPPLRLR